MQAGMQAFPSKSCGKSCEDMLTCADAEQSRCCRSAATCVTRCTRRYTRSAWAAWYATCFSVFRSAAAPVECRHSRVARSRFSSFAKPPCTSSVHWFREMISVTASQLVCNTHKTLPIDPAQR